MFFARIIGFLIILGGLYLVWLKLIKPILIAKGIEVDEEKPIETRHTRKLDNLKERYHELSASAQAAEEGLYLSKTIKELEKVVIDAEAERKKL